MNGERTTADDEPAAAPIPAVVVAAAAAGAAGHCQRVRSGAVVQENGRAPAGTSWAPRTARCSGNSAAAVVGGADAHRGLAAGRGRSCGRGGADCRIWWPALTYWH